MKKRFVFAKEVKEQVAKGDTKLELPEGTKFSPEAADLIKERGIQVIFTAVAVETREKESETGRVQVGAEALETDSGGALIGVASPGKTAADMVGSIAARSPFFLVFNTNGGLVEVLENPYRDSGGGAGPLVAELMAKKGITTMVAGNFGMNIKASLDEKGIKYFEFQGRVGEALRA
jgi:predicted Fe-Mo cluster-binding NifX family protein